MHVPPLDEDDLMVYEQAFALAEATRRFLARSTTKRVIEAGFLDKDVTDELIVQSAKMSLIRRERVESARSRAKES